MFNFFKRKKSSKENNKEPKRPPRKGSLTTNQTNKVITQNDVFTTPSGSPIIKHKENLSFTSNKNNNSSVPSNTITNTVTGICSSSGDLDDEGDSQTSPPNNVNNVLPSRPPRAITSATTSSSSINMGNNISKPEDVIDDLITVSSSSVPAAATTITTTTSSKDDTTMKTAPIRQHVSDTINSIMNTTNNEQTNNSKDIKNITENKQLKVTDKTENSNLDIKETNAFISGNLIPNENNIENNKTKQQEMKQYINNDTNTNNIIETKSEQLNISKHKNSDTNKINQSTCTTVKNGIEASKLTSQINTSLEYKNTNNNQTNLNKDCNFIELIDKNIREENEQPIDFIDEQNHDEISYINKHINDNNIIDNEFQNDTETEVSLLLKETREVICLTEKDIKKCDTDENINANIILNKKSSEQWIENNNNNNNKTAVNQMEEVIDQQEEVEPLLPTIITEVLDDVKEIPTNSSTTGGNSMIICQKYISVNNQPCKEDCEANQEKMLSIRTNSSSIETFSSSPPKVTDSETDEDNSTSREFLLKNNLEEKHIDNINLKIKKHVHWADSEGRTLESFEQCSSSSSDNDEEGNDDDDDDEEDNDENRIGQNKQNEDISSEEDNDNDEESSSSEDETIQKPKENTVIYKRQDTWLDMIDDCSKISDASDKLLKKNKNEDEEEDDDDDSGEEETSDEESSGSDENDNDEEEEDEDDEDNDKDEDVEKKRMKNDADDKTDANVRSVELDSRSIIPVHELYDKIARLQQEIMIKASGLERQHTELEAAYIESESMRQKTKQLEDELHECKCRNTELTLRICNAESKLLSEGDKEKLKEAEKRIAELETELEKVKQEKQKLEEAIKKLEKERDQEVQIVRQALDDSLSEQEAMEARYKKEFEQLRSLNSNREVQMLDDFEWKLREVEKLGKKKLADTEKELTDKVRDLTAKLAKAEEELSQVAHLKLCEIELKQLRTTAHEHRKNLRTVTRQLEDLQVDEKILQEEVNRLRAAIDREKAQIVALQNSHKEEIAEKDRKTQFKLQVQKNQINSEWEEKLKRECARLKSDLEKVFREEKMVAIETEKRIRDHELLNHRQIWENKLENIKLEVSNYKKKLEEKEDLHRVELESAQTHSDRDVLDLRRKMDKLDMQYQEKIEKLQETHEQEISVVKQECERKIQQCESSAQLHLGTTRTTLELVKQQMANECDMRIEQLKRIHQEQLEDQWEKMQLEKERDIKELEEEHRQALELLEKKLEEYKKRNERSEVVTPSLKKQSSKDNNLAVQTKEEEKQINNDLTNKEQMSSREDRMLGLDMASNSQTRSAVETELRQTVDKLTKQVYEDRIEIQRLREQLSEKMSPRQQPQRPPQSQQQPQQQHHRRSRKSRSGRN